MLTTWVLEGTYMSKLNAGLGLIVALLFILTANVQAAVIYVPDDYPTIQQAVDAANAGDTIIVRDGTYVENVDVNKRLTIRSENGSGNCIVQAANSGDDVFHVTADWVNISGFTIRGAVNYPGAGIYIGANNCNITDNEISGNYRGIYLCNSNNNQIANNEISGSLDRAILLYNSSNNQLTSNEISRNFDGIDLFYDSNNNRIANNEISGNYRGIYLCNSNNNQIANNEISGNEEDGIGLSDFSNNNQIINNEISENGEFGIYLDYSNDNQIYLNNFVDNDQNVYSYNSINVWNSTQPITYYYNSQQFTNYLGNYWDNYEGNDTDGDGIGDTPYRIDYNNVDYHPLISPKDNYKLERFVISGVLEVSDLINDMGEVDTAPISNVIYSKNGITIWEVTPSLDPTRYFLTGLKFYAMLDENDSKLSILIDGEKSQSLRGLIPSLHGVENRNLDSIDTADECHQIYPYNITKTLIYSILEEVFEDLKSKSVISSGSFLNRTPVYRSNFTDRVFIFGYSIMAGEYDCNRFHNWPWGDGDDECKYVPNLYCCEYSDGTVEVTFNFDMSNPKYYYMYGRITNDNREETKFIYNNDTWLHQVNYGWKYDVRYGSSSFPSQIVLWGHKTWSQIGLWVWSAIVADSVNVTGSLYGVGSTTVDRSEEPDVFVLINLTKVALTWLPIENEAPIVNFTYSPENPVVNQTVIFNASSSYDPDGYIVSYEWDFGDGNVTNTTSPTIAHAYSSAGDYLVTLTVIDDMGYTNSTSKTISVQPAQAPTPTPTPTPTAPARGAGGGGYVIYEVPAPTPVSPISTPTPIQTPKPTPKPVPTQMTLAQILEQLKHIPTLEEVRIEVVKEVEESEGTKTIANKTLWIKIRYETTIQKVIVRFDNVTVPGYRVIHNVTVLESNARNAILRILLEISKDIAYSVDQMILPPNVKVIQREPIVGVDIVEPTKGKNATLDVIVLTKVDENEFLKGITIKHIVVPKTTPTAATGYPTTAIIGIVIASIVVVSVGFYVLRRAS